MNKNFFYATSVLVGSMVGVGIFGLPFTFAKAGFSAGIFLLVVIGLATLLIDLMYGEVILRTQEKHQLMGYSRLYLGPIFQKLIFFAAVLMAYVALLAYIIISGDFLNTLLSPFFYISVSTYSIFFAAILSLIVLKGIKTVSHVELFFSCLFVVVMALIAIAGVPVIQSQHFMSFDKSQVALPYGVLLFAFGGLMAIPIQRQILQNREKLLRRSIFLGVSFVAILYAVFTTIVVGVSGSATSPDAVSGLYEFLGGKIVTLSSLFGLFAITTCFLMVASALINTFNLDFKVRKLNAWFLVILPPLFLFLAGIRSFIGIISLAGGVALALEQILIIFLYEKARAKGDRIPEYSLNIPIWLLRVLVALFSFGIIYFLFIQ